MCLSNVMRQQFNVYIHKYIHVHMHQAKTSFMSVYPLNLHIITLKSCSLLPQIDFDSSSSRRCKSALLPHSVVYTSLKTQFQKPKSVGVCVYLKGD